MTILERCVEASTKHPSEWHPEILHRIRPMGSVSIFGHHVCFHEDLSITLVDALVYGGLHDSNSSANRAIKAGGVRINKKQCTDIKRVLTISDMLPNIGAVVLESGKFNYGIVEVVTKKDDELAATFVENVKLCISHNII